MESLDSYPNEVKEQIAVEAHYKGYLKKQDSEILSLKKDEKFKKAYFNKYKNVWHHG